MRRLIPDDGAGPPRDPITRWTIGHDLLVSLQSSTEVESMERGEAVGDPQ